MNPTICLFLTSYLLAIGTGPASPALTIYNQDFAVVRETIPLELKSGTNHVSFAGATMHLEPSSVILRDPSAKHPFQILEQNFRADPISQELLLALNEGKTIDFEIVTQEAGQSRRELIQGKIIRSGYGQPYIIDPYGYSSRGTPQPIIEIGGKLRFSLPGQPIFPALADDTILKPTLFWVIEADPAGSFDAELSYLTGGLRWEADYNLVLPERGNLLDMVGWVTMENQSGKSFDQARIKLMAGDVNKIQRVGGFQRQRSSGGGGGGSGAPPVTEKTFDEYHLYTLEHPTTLHDQEKKQIEFVRAEHVRSAALYFYDGATLDLSQLNYMVVRTESDFGVASNKKVSVRREFTNSTVNHLGLPLPKGQVRFYRRNSDGQVEFIGESLIEHTPKDEVVRVSTGNAFDLVGERKQTDFKIDNGAGAFDPTATAIDPATGLPVKPSRRFRAPSPPWMDESFEITVRNHKTDSVEIRIVEHLYRGANWQLTKKSDPWQKADAQTMEFPVQVKAGGQRTVSYTVRYTW